MNAIFNKLRPDLRLIYLVGPQCALPKRWSTHKWRCLPTISAAHQSCHMTYRWSQTSLLTSSGATHHFDGNQYERIAEQTLEHLYEEFEAIVETSGGPKDADVSLNNGVITLNLGEHGVYVINKQTPNKQIWLSSPLSGPKRYDYVDNQWIYKRDNVSLFSILSAELSMIFKRQIKIDIK